MRELLKARAESIVRQRLFTVASILSLLQCLGTVVLWVRGGSGSPNWELHAGRNGHLLIYARWYGIGWRTIGPNGVNGWDFPYATIFILTLIIPLAWAWLRWRRRGAVGQAQTEEQGLRQRIHFLLPTLIAAWIMLGIAGVAIDSGQPIIWLFAGPLELALLLNITTRRRLTRRLDRLLQGLCPACGYNLAGNTSGACPECGTPIGKAFPAHPRVPIRSG